MAPRRTTSTAATLLIAATTLLLTACAAPPPQRPLVGYAGETHSHTNPATPAATDTATPPPYVVMSQRELTDLIAVGEITERRTNGSIAVEVPITNRSDYRYTITYQLNINPTTTEDGTSSPLQPPANPQTAMIDPAQTLTIRERFDWPEDAPIPTWILNVDWASR